jgi:hypothetical protein
MPSRRKSFGETRASYHLDNSAVAHNLLVGELVLAVLPQHAVARGPVFKSD